MGDSILCVCPAKLRVGDTIDLITLLEFTNARSCLFYHSCQIGAERKRRGRTHFAFALANERVPWSNSRSGDPDQKLSCRWQPDEAPPQRQLRLVRQSDGFGPLSS